MNCAEKDINSASKSNEDIKETVDYSDGVDQQFLNILGEAIFVYSDNKIVLVNDKAVKLAGVKSCKDIIGKPIISIMRLHPDYHKIAWERLAQLEKGHYVPSMEQKIILHDDTTLDVEIASSPYVYKGNFAIMVVIKDITEKRKTQLRIQQMEQSLNQSEKRYEKLIEIFPHATFVYADNIITYANKAAASLIGLDNHFDLVGKDIADLLKPTLEFKEIVEKRKIQLLQPDTILPFMEQKIVASDGSVIDIEVAGTSFISGDKLYVTVIARDITDRKLAEQTLRESEERYSSLVEFSPDSIFICDEEHIIFSNKSGIKLLGADSLEQLVGMKFTDFIYPEYNSIVKEQVKRLISEQSYSTTFEIKVVTLDARKLDIEISGFSFNYKSKQAILAIVRDITEKKLAEQTERKLKETLEYDKLKTEFFSNISHELKTPLNIILTSIQLLHEHNQASTCEYKDKFGKYMRIMKQNCQRLLRLINNLIDITRVDAGFFNMEFSNVNIISVVEDIVLSVVEYMKSKGISLIFDTEVEEQIIGVDVDKIERVILNLLSNAIKFTKPGGHVWVNIYSGQSEIIISVKDTGIGIPPDMHQAIFDRFKQASPLFTRECEGSGIGLALVKSIIQSHGGSIGVNSVQGEGSEFIITLPIIILPEQEINSQKEKFISQENVERINIEFSDIYS